MPPGPPAARPGPSADAHAAAALLGALLLAGTALFGQIGSKPAFPPVRVAPESQANVDGAAADGSHQPAARSVTSREPLLSSGQRPATRPAEPLDLNRADASALQALPGIGTALARRIVEDRERRGPFRTPEDLLRVSGVGAQRYARLRGMVRTTETP